MPFNSHHFCMEAGGWKVSKVRVMCVCNQGAALLGTRGKFQNLKGEIMGQVKIGDTVVIHYTGTLDDGSMFDSSVGKDPLEFQVGDGNIINGLDKAIPGMEVGEKKVVEIPCADAYGEVNPENRQAVPRDQIPADIPLEIGLMLQMQSNDGQHMMPVTIVDLSEDSVTLDANHMLAGKDLTFAIELVEIKAA